MNLRYFDIARTLTKFSDHRQHKVGAVIVKRRRLLSTGFNKCKTHVLSPHPFKSCHAEFVAIHSTINKDELKGATIYVARYNRMGGMARSKPCPYCMEIIKQYGIDTIYYTDYDGPKEIIL